MDMDQWGCQSENESVSSQNRYSECSQQSTSTPISISAARFIRKRRARMLGISASSALSSSPLKPSTVSQRPVRLRRSVVESKVGKNGSDTEVKGSTANNPTEKNGTTSGKSRNGSKDKKAKSVKILPPPLTPMQLEIRRLYDSIYRSHRKTLRQSTIQSWESNWKNCAILMKQHHRFQSVKATSSVLHSRGIISANDILQATFDAAVNKASTAEKIKVLVVSESMGKTSSFVSTRQDQRVPVTTIGHVSQIPPVLDWTAIPHNMHEDDGKFLTNIPFLGDEFIDKDSNFIDEMVTLYEGKVHEDKNSSNFRKVNDEVLYMLVQTMMKIEADVPGVFNEDKEGEKVDEIETEGKVEEIKEETTDKEKMTVTPKKTTFSDVAAKLFTQTETPIKTEPVSTKLSDDSESVSMNISANESKIEDSPNVLGGESNTSNFETEKMEPDAVQMLSSQIEPRNLSMMEESNSSFVGISSFECSNKPSDDIFSILSATFKGLGSPSEIREKYENSEKARNAPQLPILPNGMEQQKPESYTIPNIEGPFAKYLPKEATMHAYQFLFCRRCFTYDCKRHTGDDQVDSKHYKRNRQKFPASSAASSSSSSANGLNFVCENPECWQKKQCDGRNAEEILTEWTPSDRSLFLCFIDSFPSNFCFIAYLMRNKSCAQVKEYADLEYVPVVESCSRGIAPRAKSKHRKKSSANSNSKKNVTRRWINKVKKTEEIREEGGIKSAGILPIRYMPCLHENGEECDASCACRINKTSCEKFCTCALTCPYRFPGCKCLSTCDSKRCICYAAARECDPDLCLGCGANEADLEKISCHNVNIQRKLHKHLLMGRSDISGWGIYIMNDAQKGEFIAEYRGELISYDESERRGHVYDKIQHTFLFELNDHFVVDATRKGNKARFVNSSKNPNCEVKRMLVNGDHRIGIYAKRFIEAGEELFYDYEDVLEKQQKAAAKRKE